MELLKPKIQTENLIDSKHGIFCDNIYDIIMDWSKESNQSILRVYLKTSLDDLLSGFIHEITNIYADEQSDSQIKQEILLKKKALDELWRCSKIYIEDYAEDYDDREFDFEDSPEDQLRDVIHSQLFQIIRGLEKMYLGC